MGKASIIPLIFLFFLITQAPILTAQERISGRVIDAATGETLPAANIQIKDTYRGTMTNEDGDFEISVSAYPVTILFRYIGYETMEIEFVRPLSDVLVELVPVSIELEELVFTGEDPAVHIMERVILRKQLWRENLDSWKAEAYTRQNLSNDEGIVSITESFSTTWWHRDKGFREIVTDKRQTNNILPDQNFAGSSYLPNFYDDDINIAGFRVVGVTHPDAFRYYDFVLAGRRQIDDDVVFDIEVYPKTRLQPSFEGMVSVLESEYAMIEVNLIPGDAIFFPPPINTVDLVYSQQFSNYGGEFWLPTDVRISGTVEVGFPGFRIPEIIFSQSASIMNYEINVPVPDSLYEKRAMITTDTLAVRENRMFTTRTEAIPLSLEERDAYDTIDSTKTLDEAFRPTGFLADLARSSDESSGTRGSGLFRDFSFNPDVRYNRVDALFLGLETSYRVNRNLTLRIMGGYNSGLDEAAYGGGFTLRSGRRNRTSLAVDYTQSTFSRTDSDNYTRFFASSNTLMGGRDYFDYYKAQRVTVTAGHRFSGLNITPRIYFSHENASSLPKVTDYSFVGGHLQRENPMVLDGLIHSVGLRFQVGETPPPFGIAGSTGAKFHIEHSNRDLLGGDADFTRFQASADFRINTFLQRRFLPNALDIRLSAFTSTGTLPVQRFGGFDGSLGFFSPYGSFKSLLNQQLEGEHGVSMHWEHNFRTVPFELLGLRGLVRRGIGVMVHGSHGKTWIDNDRLSELGFIPSWQDGWLHETGISINNIFGLFRFDTTYRIDQPGFYFGFSATRFF